MSLYSIILVELVASLKLVHWDAAAEAKNHSARDVSLGRSVEV